MMAGILWLPESEQWIKSHGQRIAAEEARKAKSRGAAYQSLADDQTDTNSASSGQGQGQLVATPSFTVALPPPDAVPLSSNGNDNNKEDINVDILSSKKSNPTTSNERQGLLASHGSSDDDYTDSSGDNDQSRCFCNCGPCHRCRCSPCDSIMKCLIRFMPANIRGRNVLLVNFMWLLQAFAISSHETLVSTYCQTPVSQGGLGWTVDQIGQLLMVQVLALIPCFFPSLHPLLQHPLKGIQYHL
jgi:hypothetical protein